MIETPNGDDAFELPPELELELRELETLIGGKEGKEAAQQQRLAYLLADELGPRLIQAKGVEIPAEMTQKLVDENFTAPADSPVRKRWIAKLSGTPSARRIVRLLQEMEELVTSP